MPPGEKRETPGIVFGWFHQVNEQLRGSLCNHKLSRGISLSQIFLLNCQSKFYIKRVNDFATFVQLTTKTARKNATQLQHTEI